MSDNISGKRSQSGRWGQTSALQHWGPMLEEQWLPHATPNWWYDSIHPLVCTPPTFNGNHFIIGQMKRPRSSLLGFYGFLKPLFFKGKKGLCSFRNHCHPALPFLQEEARFGLLPSLPGLRLKLIPHWSPGLSPWPQWAVINTS